MVIIKELFGNYFNTEETNMQFLTTMLLNKSVKKLPGKFCIEESYKNLESADF